MRARVPPRVCAPGTASLRRRGLAIIRERNLEAWPSAPRCRARRGSRPGRADGSLEYVLLGQLHSEGVAWQASVSGTWSHGRRRSVVAPAGDRGRAALTVALCFVARHRAPRSAAALLAEEKPRKLASWLELYSLSGHTRPLCCSKCSCGLMDKAPPS